MKEFFDFLSPLLIPLLTMAMGFWMKGRYDKRVNSAATDLQEIDTHKELYAKMQKEFVQLHTKLLEYQNTVLDLTSSNQELNRTVEQLTETVSKLEKEVHASTQRAELYRQALQSKNDE